MGRSYGHAPGRGRGRGDRQAQTSLVFTNTRSQCEVWYQALLEARPQWAGAIALHHGSLDQEVREWVERGLKNGLLKVVVCTSSLDLGVDFLPVERVFQIGSPKGVARLMQRAGRSGHAPGRPSRVTIVPTHALELVEAAAAREAVAKRQIECRETPDKPFDVLVQHLVTVAIGGGFDARDLYDEVRTTYAYRQLTQDEFDWALRFRRRRRRPRCARTRTTRVVRESDGLYRVPREDLVRRHRNNVGTIVANGTLNVAYLAGGRIGAIEESFISRLKPGDIFTFGGRALESDSRAGHDCVGQTRDLRHAARCRNGQAAACRLLELARGDVDDARARRRRHLSTNPRCAVARPLLEIAVRNGRLCPQPGLLVAEVPSSRAKGITSSVVHLRGAPQHIGLGALLAWRIAREKPGNFSISMNDYGFELLSAQPFDLGRGIARVNCSRRNNSITTFWRAHQLVSCLRRRFRQIARGGRGSYSRDIQGSRRAPGNCRPPAAFSMRSSGNH